MGRIGMVYGVRANGEEFPIEASISKVGVGKQKIYTVILRDVTERLKVEQDLRDSEERLDLAVRGADLGTWDWNVNTGQVHLNERWAAMLGYSRDEIDSHVGAWEKLLHPEDKAQVMKTLQDHLDDRTSYYQTEHRLRAKSGKWKWILDTGRVVSRDTKGKPLRVTGTHQDITVRKEAEQELYREREFSNAVLETAGALVVVLDREGRIVRFNRACEDLTGYSFQEVKSKPIWDILVLPEEVPLVRRVFRSLRREKIPNVAENYWVTKDRSNRLISWSNTTLPDEHGQIKYVIGTGLDVTDRRKAEQIIDRLWHQNELILHSAGEGIYGIDKDGKVTFFNQAAEKLTGWTSKELLGRVVHPVLHHTKPDRNSLSMGRMSNIFFIEEGRHSSNCHGYILAERTILISLLSTRAQRSAPKTEISKVRSLRLTISPSANCQRQKYGRVMSDSRPL